MRCRASRLLAPSSWARPVYSLDPSLDSSPSPSPSLILRQAILRDVLPLARREAVTSKIAIVRPPSPVVLDRVSVRV